jgi:hypothetical protein
MPWLSQMVGGDMLVRYGVVQKSVGNIHPGVNALPASAVPQSDDNLCAPPVDTSLSSGTQDKTYLACREQERKD